MQRVKPCKVQSLVPSAKLGPLDLIDQHRMRQVPVLHVSRLHTLLKHLEWIVLINLVGTWPWFVTRGKVVQASVHPSEAYFYRCFLLQHLLT